MNFSRRSAWSSEPSEWAAAVRSARARGPLLDLRGSNPTTAGLAHPAAVLGALASPAAATYEPCAQGLPSARAAVADYYAQRGRTVDPAWVWLHASTSEAYLQWLTILADPGDSVLVPRPGYPLFDTLTELAGVRAVPYPIEFDGQWFVDPEHIREIAAATERLRAVFVVAPGNPTGHVPTATQWRWLQRVAREQSAVLVVDEVFADYQVAAAGLNDLGDTQPPTLVLSGLSKVAALPQVKLAWTVVQGPPTWRRPLLSRMDHLGDATLTVSGPVQHALPHLLDAAADLQPTIRQRLAEGRRIIDEGLRGSAASRAASDGGWTALLRLPALPGFDDERWGRALLRAGVWVQPGFLFDLDRGPWVAVSLLTPSQRLQRGVAAMRAVVDRVVAEA